MHQCVYRFEQFFGLVFVSKFDRLQMIAANVRLDIDLPDQRGINRTVGMIRIECRRFLVCSSLRLFASFAIVDPIAELVTSEIEVQTVRGAWRAPRASKALLSHCGVLIGTQATLAHCLARSLLERNLSPVQIVTVRLEGSKLEFPSCSNSSGWLGYQLIAEIVED